MEGSLYKVGTPPPHNSDTHTSRFDCYESGCGCACPKLHATDLNPNSLEGGGETIIGLLLSAYLLMDFYSMPPSTWAAIVVGIIFYDSHCLGLYLIPPVS